MVSSVTFHIVLPVYNIIVKSYTLWRHNIKRKSIINYENVFYHSEGWVILLVLEMK